MSGAQEPDPQDPNSSSLNSPEPNLEEPNLEELDYVLNGNHGAAYTTTTGERRWRCEYCALDRLLSDFNMIQAHLRLVHGVVNTTVVEVGKRAGQKARETMERWKHVLDVTYGKCYTGKNGEKRWQCRFCPSDLLAAHTEGLRRIRKHLKG